MIAGIARRFLNLLFTFGIYDKHFKVVHEGEIPSTNKFYEARHWTVRAGLKVKWTKIFDILLLEAKVKPVKEFSIFVFYNSRHDCDNLSIFSKMCVDTMKGKYIQDDTKKYYKSTHTIHDDTLKKNCFEIHILAK